MIRVGWALVFLPAQVLIAISCIVMLIACLPLVAWLAFEDLYDVPV